MTLTDIALALGFLAIAVLLSFGFAVMGEPSSEWLWRSVLGAI